MVVLYLEGTGGTGLLRRGAGVGLRLGLVGEMTIARVDTEFSL